MKPTTNRNLFTLSNLSLSRPAGHCPLDGLCPVPHPLQQRSTIGHMNVRYLERLGKLQSRILQPGMDDIAVLFPRAASAPSAPGVNHVGFVAPGSEAGPNLRAAAISKEPNRRYLWTLVRPGGRYRLTPTRFLLDALDAKCSPTTIGLQTSHAPS